MKSTKIIVSSLLLGWLISYPVLTLASQSASFLLSPSTKAIVVGDQFYVDISVSSTEEALNAVSGTIPFSSELKLISITKPSSIVNFWTEDPHPVGSKVRFEGVVLNPGYQGPKGLIFRLNFEAQKEGDANIYFSDGSILANDGKGTNIIGSLNSLTLHINSPSLAVVSKPTTQINIKKETNPDILPVILEYSPSVNSKESGYLKGKGAPDAITKISFKDVSHKSYGEQFMDFIQSKKKKLSDVLVKNNKEGLFNYETPSNLVAGVYNATPFLVDNKTNTDKPGLGVQLLVNDNKIVKGLVTFINVLLLLIPIVGLAVVIYFIPWYSSRRMRILKKKMGLEEEKIEITEHQLKRQDELISKTDQLDMNTEKKG